MTTPRRTALRFRERAELLDFLLEVSRVSSETLDLAEQLSTIASIVKEVVPYDVFAILLYSERTHALTIRHAIGHREEVVRSLSIPLGVIDLGKYLASHIMNSSCQCRVAFYLAIIP